MPKKYNIKTKNAPMPLIRIPYWLDSYFTKEDDKMYYYYIDREMTTAEQLSLSNLPMWMTPDVDCMTHKKHGTILRIYKDSKDKAGDSYQMPYSVPAKKSR